MSNARLELTPLLLDSLYTEAMLLADEARACFDRSHDAGQLAPEISVAFSCESLKVTTRLMHSIAWLLNQKAVRAGEISESDAQNEARNLGYAPASDGPLVLQFPLEAQALIGASVEKVENGTQLVSNAGQSMEDIVAQVQRVSDLIGEISSATGEQTIGISQVGEAVMQLDQVTQQNAALVEESAAAASSMMEQTSRLSEVLAAFRLEGGSQLRLPR